MYELDDILTQAMNMGASDVHLVPAHRPSARIHTVLEPIGGMDTILTSEDTNRMTRQMLGEDRWGGFQRLRDADFAYHVKGLGRFRVNAHYENDSIGIAFRSIAEDVPELEKLCLPPVAEKFVDLPRGLVLVTGPTGSGKSTTLASLIDKMNQQFKKHVITLEDPVEYQLKSKQCLIEQREVGLDVPSFASGLKHALRQDPDIILVGEMRDLETTSSAITAAETGHLVLSTMHTQSASQTLQRIIDIFPPAQQAQIRSMLSLTLQAVVTQTLFRRKDKSGMVPACEVMICNAAIRNCIRENRVHEIPNILETHRQFGMCLLDESIRNLAINGIIEIEDALARANNPKGLRQQLGL